jgi:hypothetical protein
MAARTAWPRLLLLGGLLMVALGVLADRLGAGHSPRLGRTDVAVLVVGIVLAVAGLVTRRRPT